MIGVPLLAVDRAYQLQFASRNRKQCCFTSGGPHCSELKCRQRLLGGDKCPEL
jgi:hypothetical protein